MPQHSTPEPDVQLDISTVRRLVDEQFPEFRTLRLEHAGAGWDNSLFRLGHDLVVRLPRRVIAAPLVDHEATWLPGLAPALPLPIPAPVRVGEPTESYPWRWTVCPWFEGRAAVEAPPRDLRRAANAIGEFLRALHAPASPDAPRSPFRGIPLAERDAGTRAHAADLDGMIDGEAVVAAWEVLVDTPTWSGPPVWVHGDVHPGNLIVRDGELVAVIDFGDLSAGDPATDLTIAWSMFDPTERELLRTAVGHDDDTWRRGRAWALTVGLSVLRSSSDNPPYEAFGRRMIEAALSESG